MWNFQDFKNNIALISDIGKEVSYGDLEISGNKIVDKIDGRCLVFCLCTNTVASIIGYVSFIQHRIVPLLLDSQIDQGLLQSLIDKYRPQYFWVPSKISSSLELGDIIYSDLDYVLIKSFSSNIVSLNDELALLLTTSGSTGSSKLVRQSYANIKSNTESIVKYLELDSTERAITSLPMNYTYGLSIINSHLYSGATLILTEYSLMQNEFWKKIKDNKVSSIGGVPYTYEMLNRLKFFKMELPHLKTLTQAGGKLLADLHKKFAEFASENGKKFIVMYGQTEATARISYLPHNKSIEKVGSIGIAIPGGKLSLIDTDGSLINKSNITGELVYQGPNVALGYADAIEDLSKGDDFEGELLTGDMAKRDDDGYYFIVGRKKRFIKIFGNRVNLDETEQLLKSNFVQTEIACTGIDDKMYIFITSASILNDVKKYLVNLTGINHTAFKIIYLMDLPKNQTGKIQYEALKSYFNA